MIFASAGCETKAGTGALVGGAGGAAVGGGIGSFSHSRAGEGALIGGAVGAVGGAVVGNEMDKKDQRDRERASRRAREERYDSDRRVTKKDVIKWTKDGVKDEIIIDRIDRSGTVFRMTAADENDLRDAGVSEDVVRAMKNTARK
jgi:uncharacterized protein YcfJ